MGLSPVGASGGEVTLRGWRDPAGINHGSVSSLTVDIIIAQPVLG